MIGFKKKDRIELNRRGCSTVETVLELEPDCTEVRSWRITIATKGHYIPGERYTMREFNGQERGVTVQSVHPIPNRDSKRVVFSTVNQTVSDTFATQRNLNPVQ